MSCRRLDFDDQVRIVFPDQKEQQVVVFNMESKLYILKFFSEFPIKYQGFLNVLAQIVGQSNEFEGYKIMLQKGYVTLNDLLEAEKQGSFCIIKGLMKIYEGRIFLQDLKDLFKAQHLIERTKPEMISEIEELRKETYFHGVLNSEKAKSLLKKEPVVSQTYLLRISLKGEPHFVISWVNDEKRVFHCPLETIKDFSQGNGPTKQIPIKDKHGKYSQITLHYPKSKKWVPYKDEEKKVFLSLFNPLKV